MRPFERNRNLTEAERIRRIGELLVTAVMRYRHLHPEEFEKNARFSRDRGRGASGGFDPASFVTDESEKRTQTGASPRQQPCNRIGQNKRGALPTGAT
ncbi:MAG: hypothetical protein LBK99_12475 [Opitutaceae bacterium]|jgi:hypothetical protein|nr:hypothetical protein [Opitutaceae bacterium]